MHQFARAIDGMAAACTALAMPIVSGNVSLYNETSTKDGTRAVLPTPGIAGVGLFGSEEDIVTQYFKADGDVVLLLGRAVGTAKSSLSGSEWLTRTIGRICGETPVIDLGARVRRPAARARAVPRPSPVERPRRLRGGPRGRPRRVRHHRPPGRARSRRGREGGSPRRGAALGPRRVLRRGAHPRGPVGQADPGAPDPGASPRRPAFPAKRWASWAVPT